MHVKPGDCTVCARISIRVYNARNIILHCLRTYFLVYIPLRATSHWIRAGFKFAGACYYWSLLVLCLKARASSLWSLVLGGVLLARIFAHVYICVRSILLHCWHTFAHVYLHTHTTSYYCFHRAADAGAAFSTFLPFEMWVSRNACLPGAFVFRVSALPGRLEAANRAKAKSSLSCRTKEDCVLGQAKHKNSEDLNENGKEGGTKDEERYIPRLKHRRVSFDLASWGLAGSFEAADDKNCAVKAPHPRRWGLELLSGLRQVQSSRSHPTLRDLYGTKLRLSSGTGRKQGSRKDSAKKKGHGLRSASEGFVFSRDNEIIPVPEALCAYVSLKAS